MKKTMLTTLTAVSVLISVLTGCGGSGIAGTAAAPAENASEAPAAPAQPAPAAAEGKKVRVAIVQPMTHTSLDQIRETIIANLAEDTGIEIVTQNANGDTAALTSILQNLKSEKTDIIVPIATSTAQTAKAVYDGEKTPIVFAAVSDPVAAGLTGEGSEMITGVSNNIPADEIVKLVYNFQPECKKIGFVYTSSETNSVHLQRLRTADCGGIPSQQGSRSALYRQRQYHCQRYGNIHLRGLSEADPDLLRCGLHGGRRRFCHGWCELCSAGRAGGGDR